MSRVTVAQSAGFCFGVRRAVDLAEREAAKHQTLYSYGEIIHNTHETRRLEKLGVRTAECTSDIPDGAAVLIRAHGVTRAVYEELEAKGNLDEAEHNLHAVEPRAGFALHLLKERREHRENGERQGEGHGKGQHRDHRSPELTLSGLDQHGADNRSRAGE